MCSEGSFSSKDGGAIHESSYNPADKEKVVSVRLNCENRAVTCHVYPNGDVTARKGGSPL